MADHFAPVYLSRIILIKVPPFRFLAKMFIFVLVPRTLIMSRVQRKIIFDHSSHRQGTESKCQTVGILATSKCGKGLCFEVELYR